MIKISRSIIASVQAAQTGDDLCAHLQKAIELEHSTIPPYLAAWFSLQSSNAGIARLIKQIVIEEMLHMTYAANLLIAIGGQPAINKPGFIPNYPGPLPMNIGDLVVSIEAFSLPLVKNVFMTIEEPEHPIPIQRNLSTAAEEYATIGEFYDAVKAQITTLGPGIFKQTTAPPQVLSTYFPQLSVIANPEDAGRAIDLVKTQGEGTSGSPFEDGNNPAHFYKFGEIVAGKTIQKTPNGFAYGDPPILFDASGVNKLRPNCKIDDYPQGSSARTVIMQFAASYSRMLDALHDAFNGHAQNIDTVIDSMSDLADLAQDVMQTPDPTSPGLNVGLSFEYVPAS